MSHLLAPFLCQLFCYSLDHGVVPSKLKAAYIMPIVKQAGMDPTETKSYSPMSNLSVLSKLLERLVCSDVVSVSTSRSRDSLETYFRNVSVSGN